MSAENRRMPSARSVIFPFLPLCLWRIVYYQRFAKTENGSDLIKNGAPLFCNFPAAVTASGFFYSRCSGLIFKDLPTFWKNGEFSAFTFRDIKSADLPPDSPFALCRGHTDLKSLNLAQRSSLRRHTHIPVRILQ